MKAKTFFVFLAIFMAVTFSTNAQTRQQKKALEMVANEKATLEKELAELETSIATYVAIDTLPIYSRKREIDVALAGGEMSIGQKAAYSDQSHKLGRKLASMRQQLLVATAGLKADKARVTEIKLRLQELNDYQVTLINSQLDEAVNKTLSQEVTWSEERRRHRSNRVESEEIQLQREWLGIEKLSSAPVKADKAKGYLGMVTWNVSPGRDTTQMITFVIYNKGKKVDGISISCHPGQIVEAYLLPGEYICEAWFGSKNLGQRNFSVGPEIQQWGNNPYHWYNYYNKKILSRPDYL